MSIFLAFLVGFLKSTNGNTNIVVMLTFVDQTIAILVVLGEMVSDYMKSKYILQAVSLIGEQIECNRNQLWFLKFCSTLWKI